MKELVEFNPETINLQKLGKLMNEKFVTEMKERGEELAIAVKEGEMKEQLAVDYYNAEASSCLILEAEEFGIPNEELGWSIDMAEDIYLQYGGNLDEFDPRKYNFLLGNFSNEIKELD